MTDHGLSPSTRRRRLVVGGLVVAFTAVLIAIVMVRSAGEKVLNGNGDVRVLVGEDVDGGLDAMGGGTLADVGGCLGWAPRGGEETGTLVIWPHGTTIKKPDPLRITVDGTTYGIGDNIRIAGGESGPLEPSDHFYDKVPKACRAANVFLANNG